MMSEQVTIRIDDRDMPSPYTVLDVAAIRIARGYASLSRLEIFLFLAAALATIPAWQYGGLNVSLAIASICFGLALAIQAYISIGRLEERSHKARDGAENIKSLAWRFAMAAQPFDGSTENASMLFDELAVEIFRAAGGDHIRGGVKSLRTLQISSAMMATRLSSLAERRALFKEGRCQDQQNWYRRKSYQSRQRARMTNALTATVEVVALLGLLARAIGIFGLDVYSIAAAVGGANASLAQIQQWQRRRDEYKEKASDIIAAEAIIASLGNEIDFASKVSEVEEILTGVPLSKLRLYADSGNPGYGAN